MQSAREAATLLLRTQMLLSVASQAAALVPSLHSPGHHLLGKSPLWTRDLGHCRQNWDNWHLCGTCFVQSVLKLAGHGGCDDGTRACVSSPILTWDREGTVTLCDRGDVACHLSKTSAALWHSPSASAGAVVKLANSWQSQRCLRRACRQPVTQKNPDCEVLTCAAEERAHLCCCSCGTVEHMWCCDCGTPPVESWVEEGGKGGSRSFYRLRVLTQCCSGVGKE